MAEKRTLLVELHRMLQLECFCKAPEEVLTSLRSLVCNTLCSIPANESEEFDVILQSCSLIEGICSLYFKHVNTGHTCRTLKELIHWYQTSSIGLQDFLLQLVLCKRKYLTYAASKALIALLLVYGQSGESAGISVNHVCQKMAEFADDGEETILDRLSFFEHLLMSVGQLTKTTFENEGRNHNCNSIAITKTEIAVIDANHVCKLLLSKTSVPKLIRRSVSCGSKMKVGTLHSILRILVVFVPLENVRHTLMQDPFPLFELLTHEMPLLIWKRSCWVLKELINYNATIAVGNVVQEEQLKVASHFLKRMETSFWHNMPHCCGWHCFSGSFVSGPLVTNSDMLTPADKPLLQCFVLADLAFLATVATYLRSCTDNELVEVKEEYRKLLAHGLLSTEEFIKLKVVPRLCSSEEEANARLHYFIMLFSDQDDAIVEALLYLLEIWRYLDSMLLTRSEDLYFSPELWNPHIHFYVFVLLIKKDYSVFLDFLISDETCFLLYLVKYLKLAIDNWEKLVEAHATSHFNRMQCHHTSHRSCNTTDRVQGAINCPKKNGTTTAAAVNTASISTASRVHHLDAEMKLVDYDSSSESGSTSGDEAPFDRNSLDDLVSLFSKLRSTIQRQTCKNIFPYNAVPLVKLLRNFIEKYEHRRS